MIIVSSSLSLSIRLQKFIFSLPSFSERTHLRCQVYPLSKTRKHALHQAGRKGKTRSLHRETLMVILRILGALLNRISKAYWKRKDVDLSPVFKELPLEWFEVASGQANQRKEKERRKKLNRSENLPLF